GEEGGLRSGGGPAGGRAAAGRLMVDMGGGWTEVVPGATRGAAGSASIDVGCVRLTERFPGWAPPTAPELAAAGAYVRALLPDVQAKHAIGVAGTVTTLAALDLELDEYDPRRTHGHVLSRPSVEGPLAR